MLLRINYKRIYNEHVLLFNMICKNYSNQNNFINLQDFTPKIDAKIEAYAHPLF